MSISLFLEGANVIGKLAKGYNTSKSAKKLANEQKKTNEMYYEYNKQQLEKAYNGAFANNMNKYINDRLAITNEYNDIQTKLNINASKESINLNDSSYTNDAQNQLDLEFNNNLQNTYTNLVDKTADLILNKTTMDAKLENQYMEKINSIDRTVTEVENAMIDKLGESLIQFSTDLADDYGAYKTKQEKANKQSSIKDYLSTDLLNFKL